MIKAITQKGVLTVGYVGLGIRGNATVGSILQEVHDGDTITVRALGNLSVRFLGVDAPEISLTLPNEIVFTSIGNEKWEKFLENPFASNLPPFTPPLTKDLAFHLQSKLKNRTAINHFYHAQKAEDTLEEELKKDLHALHQSEKEFTLFLAFAHEVMDRYGRLLCFINRNQVSKEDPEPRPLTYNERLLRLGKVMPYFIWPNINPFRKQKNIVDAVPQPGTANTIVNKEGTLGRAREWVQHARQRQIGIYDETNPLQIEPFEVRFLARRRPPDRWVIDLSKNDNILIQPQRYYRVSHSEDRLFIPPEYVPLFLEAGWQHG